MDPATLAETVRNAAFASTQFRDGYDEDAVDQLLDEIVRAVETGSSASEVAALASNAKFPMTSMRRGYDCDDVDDLLGEVARQATGEVVPQASGPVTASSHTPLSVSQESSGLGARLLRLLRGD